MTSRVLLTLSWTFVLLLRSTGAQHRNVSVTIAGLGTVEGAVGQTAWTGRTIYKFQNIKYAESPSGEQRFRAPVAMKPWTGVMNATVPGRACPQLGYSSAPAGVDLEDCLSLSVYTENLESSRPVMVFIHGGAFIMGSAETYGPEYLLEKDIVLVVIQYRLGPLGFLSTETANIPGNVAMLDMIMALEWVSTNIPQFGGSRLHVTVFGESAGAAAVSALLYSPMVRNDLFHRAIIQSGSISAPWATCKSPKEGALDIARRVSCSGTLENIETCLRRVSPLDLMDAYEKHKNEQFNITGYPDVSGACIVIGGSSPFLQNHPKTYARSALRNIGVLAGTCSQEGLLFWEDVYRHGLSVRPEMLRSPWEYFDLLDTINGRFGASSNDGANLGYQAFGTFLKSELDRANYTELLPGLVDICGNLAIKAPVLQDVNAFASVNSGKVFLYSFDYKGEPSMYNFDSLPDFKYPYPNSVFHADDLFYLFPLGQRLNEDDTVMAQTMVDLWTSFAINGVPSARAISYWPPATQVYGPYFSIAKDSVKHELYFNEFTASIDKARTSGGGKSTIAVGLIGIIAALSCYINLKGHR